MDLKHRLGLPTLFQVGCIGKSFLGIFNTQKLLYFIEEKMQVGDFPLLGAQVIPVQALIEQQNPFTFFLLCQSPQLQKMPDSSKLLIYAN